MCIRDSCRTEWGDTANSYYDVIWTGEKFVILGRDSILSFSPNDIIKLSVNGRFIPMDSAPIIENDRTLVPARAVFEALQAQVFWEDKTNTAVIRTDFSEIRLQADSSTAVVNGAAVPKMCIRDREGMEPLPYNGIAGLSIVGAN